RRGGWRLVVELGSASAPAILVALVRLVAFGHVAPLALFAKPSDFEHGLWYVLAALLWTGAPLLVVAPRAIPRLDGDSRAILVAVGFHCFALILAGGDWMSLFRL